MSSMKKEIDAPEVLVKIWRGFVLTLAVALVPGIAFAQGARGAGVGAARPDTPFLGPFGVPPDVTVPKGTAVVLGQVVDEGSGQPIAEAIVSIRINAPGARGGNPMAGRGGVGRGQAAPQPAPAQPDGPRIPMVTRIITDAEGRFVLRDLPKGSFSYSVDVPGYFGTSSSRSVGEGERVRDFKITMQKYGVITGMILDDVGDPAVNVSVRAMRRDRTGFQFVTEDKTDDRGIYRLADLRPGDYAIAVPQTQATVPVATFNSLMQGMMGGSSASGLRDLAAASAGVAATSSLRVGDLQVGSTSGMTPVMNATGRIYVAPTTFYPSASTPGGATVIKVGSGEERSGIDIQLRVVPTVKVTGTVDGPAGTGLLQIQLRPASADAGQTDLDVATTVATTNGVFTFLGVPAGQYIARIVRQPPPEIPAELASNPLIQMALGSRGAGTQTMLFAQAPVSVANTDVSGVVLSLTPGLTFAGHLVFDGASPKPDANALAAINVQLSSPGTPSGPPPSGRVDFTGGFKTSGGLPGHYTVNVSSEPVPWVLASMIVNGHDVLREGIDLDADVRDAVATFTDRAVTITGTVRATSGPLPESTTVLLLPEDVEGWIARGMTTRGSSVGGAAPSGAFSIGRVLPGQYLIAAVASSDYAPQDPAFLRAVARAATKITVAAGDHPTIDAPLVKIR